MRFKNWLNESEEDRDYIDKIVDVIHGKFDQAFHNRKQLYRGTTNKRDWPYEIIKKSFKKGGLGVRREKGSKSIDLQMMTEICPEWKKFPDRLQSTILSVNSQEAFDFADHKGGLYWVLPKNGATIAVAPTDFNYKNEWPFNEKYFQLDYFDTEMMTVFYPQLFLLMTDIKDIPEDNLLDRMGNKYAMFIWFKENWKKIDQHIKSKYKNTQNLIDKALDKILVNGKIPPVYNRYFILRSAEVFFKVLHKEFGNDLEKMLKAMVCPEENGFSVCKINELDAHVRGFKAEVWTEAPCLYIGADDFNNVRDRYRTKYGKK